MVSNACAGTLQGSMSPEELFKNCTQDSEQLTARCFVGLSFVLNGKKQRAAELLNCVCANAKPGCDEYMLAASGLSKLKLRAPQTEASADNFPLVSSADKKGHQLIVIIH